MSNVPLPKESNQIQRLVEACESLCDALRKLRRSDPNKFYDTANEKLLKGIDASINGYYSWAVTEERDLKRLYREINELNIENSELERKIKALEKPTL